MTIEQARVLADAAKQAVEEHRVEIDLTDDTVTVDDSWGYTLPDEYQERREDPWLR